MEPSGHSKMRSAKSQVLLQRLALMREDRNAGRGDGGGGVILGGEDVARRPAHLGAEVNQRFDQHRRLNRHVQRAGDLRALQGLRFAKFLADRHQAGHLGLGDGDLGAAPVREADILDGEIAGNVLQFGRGHSGGAHDCPCVCGSWAGSIARPAGQEHIKRCLCPFVCQRRFRVSGGTDGRSSPLKGGMG